MAQQAGVRLPSLYKHIDGLPALHRDLAVMAKRDLAEALARATAGRARGDALRALASAYVDWARAHPGWYAVALRAPTPGDEEDAAASTAAAEAVYAALRGYGLAEDAAVDAVRTLRAVLHGFIGLEAAGGFGLPRPVGDSLAWALAAFERALERAHEGCP